MYNKKQILGLYNSISENKLDQNELLTILPKLYLIMNKIQIDEIEIINIIDTLEEIKNNGELEKINTEIIDLIIRITKKDQINLAGTLYFSIILKHVLLPYKKNICDKDYNLILFLSEFEIFLELVNKMLNKKDLLILDKYNHELKEVIVKYKDAMTIYNKHVVNDVILSSMISHFASMLYFNLEDFDYNYDLICEIVVNIINNYPTFIDYCCALDLHKNYTRINTDLTGIELEYIVSNEMLNYLYNNQKKEKVKRKC